MRIPARWVCGGTFDVGDQRIRLSDELRTIRRQAAENPPKPMDRGWKQFERRIAKSLGGRRVPLSGGLAPESNLPKTDVMGTVFDDVEAKLRARWDIPGWIRLLEGRTRLSINPLAWLLVVKKPRTQRPYAVLALPALEHLVRMAGMGDLIRVFAHQRTYQDCVWHIEKWLDEIEADHPPLTWVLEFNRKGETPGGQPWYAMLRLESVVALVQEIRMKGS